MWGIASCIKETLISLIDLGISINKRWQITSLWLGKQMGSCKQRKSGVSLDLEVPLIFRWKARGSKWEVNRIHDYKDENTRGIKLVFYPLGFEVGLHFYSSYNQSSWWKTVLSQCLLQHQLALCTFGQGMTFCPFCWPRARTIKQALSMIVFVSLPWHI